MRRTKIVCTLGPATTEVSVLQALIEAGMDVARFNFSHGTHAGHAAMVAAVRQAVKTTGKNIALLLDTKGPEIRIGSIAEGEVLLQEGATFTLTTNDVLGDQKQVSVNYPGITKDVEPGMQILLDDGLITLEAKHVTEDAIQCRIIRGGVLCSHKGVNIPDAYVQLPPLSAKDREDIKFAIEHDFDFIAASFIRKAEDVLAIRAVLEEFNSDMQIIAKIENREGVENIDKILATADGIMIARGDLGVEVPTEDVPLIQKMIIRKCNAVGKPVITATQMLDSMIRNPLPTRAEASDVANAIFDGTDAVMLSGETAVGKYPVEAVHTMARIAERTEEALEYKKMLEIFEPPQERSVTDAIAFATCYAAQGLGANAIITSTQSGFTARNVSKYKPKAQIIAVTPSKAVARRLNLTWGVAPLLCEPSTTTDEMFSAAVAAAIENQYIKNGDLVIFTAGVPVGVSGTTNFLRVHTVGEIVLQGTGLGKKSVTGQVKIAKTAAAAAQLQKGQILVASATDKDYLPHLQRAAGLLIEEGGLTSHAAIVALNLGLPAIVGATGATGKLSDGETITLDTVRGLVYRGRATTF